MQESYRENEMRSVLVAVAAALAITAPPPSVASGYETYGPGVATCGTWVTERNQGAGQDMFGWVLGYVTAAGYYTSFTLRGTDSEGMRVYMDNYCKQHPLDRLEKGVQRLVQDLRTDKGAQ